MRFSFLIPQPSIVESPQFGAKVWPFYGGPEPMRYEVWVHGRGRHGEIFLTVNGANLIGIATNQALVLSRGVSTRSNGNMRVLTSFEFDDLPASLVALLKILQQAGPEIELGGFCDRCGMPDADGAPPKCHADLVRRMPNQAGPQLEWSGVNHRQCNIGQSTN
jgi:hypothetical protein